MPLFREPAVRNLGNVPALTENDVQDAAAFRRFELEIFEFEAEAVPEPRVVKNLLLAMVNPRGQVLFLAVTFVNALLELVLYSLLKLGKSVIQNSLARACFLVWLCHISWSES